MERSEEREKEFKKYFEGLEYETLLVCFFEKCKDLIEKDLEGKTWYRWYADPFCIWKDSASVTICTNGGNNSVFCTIIPSKIDWSDKPPILKSEIDRRRLMVLILANVYARKL